MNFDLTPAQTDLQGKIKDFASAELGRDVTDWRYNWDKCGDFGILGINVPEALGGSGMGVVAQVLALEAVGHGCSDNGLGLGLAGQVWVVQEPLLTFGTEAQKAAYLPGLASGKLVGALGLTEQNAGSDVLNLKTRAQKQDGGYVINGAKAFIGMAPACDMAIVFAMTEPTHGKWGISAFIVEASDAGFTRGKPEQKMGMRSIPMGDLHFENVYLPASRMLGAEGAGMAVFQHIMEWERSFIFSGNVGAMARQLEDCVAYAHKRETFGKPIFEHQSVSNRLADMKLRLETARLHLYRAAQLKEDGKAAMMVAAMTKLVISEAFLASSMDAVRIHGGVGYMSGLGVEHNLRDAVGGVIYSGTSDIQRQIIAQLLK